MLDVVQAVMIDSMGMRRKAKIVRNTSQAWVVLCADVVNEHAKNEWLWQLWPAPDNQQFSLWFDSKAEMLEKLCELFGTEEIAKIAGKL